MLLTMIMKLMGKARASKQIHKELTGKVMYLPMAFFDTVPLGRIMNRFSSDIESVDTTNLFIVYGTIINIASSLIGIAVVKPRFFIVIPIILLIQWRLKDIYIQSSRQLRRLASVSRSPVYSIFGETLQGMNVIRAFRQEDHFRSLIHPRVDLQFLSFFYQISADRWLRLALDCTGAAVVIFSTLYAIYDNETSPGQAGLIISYALNVTMLIGKGLRKVSKLENEIVALERVLEYSELPIESGWSAPFTPATPSSSSTSCSTSSSTSSSLSLSWPDKGSIIFRNFSLRYRPHLDLVLTNLNFSVESGQRIAIVGRTGAGKSSLALGLFRIIEAAEGSIEIDGIPISKLNLGDLRSNISIIPQDPVIFSGTIRMNLDPFESHDDIKIWRALKAAKQENFVSQLPGGLDYVCTELGENLSIGQRQLLCLARALLRNSKILVLDEATAAVDLETDSVIQKTIQESFVDVTILTIAHRIHNVVNYDKVLVLDQGRIIEFQSPSQLLKDTTSMFYALAKDAGVVG